MIILKRSIHVIDYENNRTLEREIPDTFDDYVRELIEHINNNVTIRDFKTRSKYTEVVSGALEILKQHYDVDVVTERTNSIANRLLTKEIEVQESIGKLNTHVQKGSLIQALLYDEQESSYVYLLAKVEHSVFVDDVDFSFKTGFSKDKKTLWKSCLLDLACEDDETFYAKIYSNTSAKFWSDSFLELDEMINDETNTLKSFKAIDAVLNTNLRGLVTKDHTVIRNGFIVYYRNKDFINFPEMVDSVLGHYSPIDIDAEKVADIRNKILELPGKKGFDLQFNPVSAVINARIRKTYDVNNGIQLRITDAIEDLDETITAFRDELGNRYIRIKTNNEATFRRFKKVE